jgi:hypothetical protein
MHPGTRRWYVAIVSLAAVLAGSCLLSAPTSRADRPRQGQVPSPGTVLGQLGGAVSAAVAEGGIVWAAVGPRIVQLDWSEPDRPQMTWQSQVFDGPVTDLVAADGLLLAATGRSLIVLRPGGGPAPPTVVVERLRDGGKRSFVSWSEDRAYVVAVDDLVSPAAGTLSVYDLSDSRSPTWLGQVEVPAGIMDAEILGDYAYLVTLPALYYLSVKDPAAFGPVGFMKDCCLRIIKRDGQQLVTVRDDIPRALEMLEWVDVSSPTTPRIWRSRTNGKYSRPVMTLSLGVHEGRVYLTGWEGEYWHHGYLDVVAGAGMRNIGTTLAHARLPGPGLALAVTDDRIQAFTSSCGWHALTYNDARKDGSFQGLEIIGSSWAQPAVVSDLAQQGTTAYLLGGAGQPCSRLDLVDVADPVAPRQLATLRLEILWTWNRVEQISMPQRVVAGPPGTVFISSDYPTPGLRYQSPQIVAVDVSRPNAPGVGDQQPYPLGVTGLAYDVRAGRLFVSSPIDRPTLATGRTERLDDPLNGGRLDAFDVPAPGRLVLAGSFELGPEPGGLAASDGLVFVAERHSDVQRYVLRSVDFQRPTAPRVLATVPMELDSRGPRPALALSGSRLFVAGAAYLVFDVTEPARPRLIDRRDGPFAEGQAPEQRTDAGSGLVAVAGAGLRLFDLSAPSPAQPFAWLSYPGLTRTALLGGRTMALAQDGGGLVVGAWMPAEGLAPASNLYLPSLWPNRTAAR